MPQSSAVPKRVPKISAANSTEAAGSIVAVTVASSGDRYKSPALNSRNASTVPQRTI